MVGMAEDVKAEVTQVKTDMIELRQVRVLLKSCTPAKISDASVSFTHGMLRNVNVGAGCRGWRSCTTALGSCTSCWAPWSAPKNNRQIVAGSGWIRSTII